MNVFDAIEELGHDFDFEPAVTEEWEATDAMPGTDEKVAVLASRVRLGIPLWHPNDRTDGDGLDPSMFRIGRVRRDR